MNGRPVVARSIGLTVGALLVALPLGAAAQQADAPKPQQVWRCGNTYSHQPCANGRTVDAQDARTPEQQEQSRAGQLRLQAVLDEREREAAAAAEAERKAAEARERAARKQRAAALREERRLEKARLKAAQQAAVRRKLHKRPAHAASDVRRAVSPPPARPKP